MERKPIKTSEIKHAIIKWIAITNRLSDAIKRDELVIRFASFLTIIINQSYAKKKKNNDLSTWKV